MAVTISGTSGVTYPSGGIDNVAGAGVGTTDTQTLTNKTLTSPTITGAAVSSMASSVITSGTAVASTSGTSIDFTSIPSWVKRITVMMNGVSTNGASAPMVQIGSGSVTTSGYLGAIMSGAEVINFTTGFYVNSNTFISSGLLYGNLVITLLGSNAYTASGATGRSDIARAFAIGGSVTLSGALDRVRITTVNGTDTFDAGSINILYE